MGATSENGPGHERAEAAIWRFMTEGLGHEYECLFSSASLDGLTDVTIPGGDILENRFLVDVVLPDCQSDEAAHRRMLDFCHKWEVHWLASVTGPRWYVSNVLGSDSLPLPFVDIDVLRPLNKAMTDDFILFESPHWSRHRWTERPF